MLSFHCLFVLPYTDWTFFSVSKGNIQKRKAVNSIKLAKVCETHKYKQRLRTFFILSIACVALICVVKQGQAVLNTEVSANFRNYDNYSTLHQ